jgi:hypothetical protein
MYLSIQDFEKCISRHRNIAATKGSRQLAKAPHDDVIDGRSSSSTTPPITVTVTVGSYVFTRTGENMSPCGLCGGGAFFNSSSSELAGVPSWTLSTLMPALWLVKACDWGETGAAEARVLCNSTHEWGQAFTYFERRRCLICIFSAIFVNVFWAADTRNCLQLSG